MLVRNEVGLLNVEAPVILVFLRDLLTFVFYLGYLFNSFLSCVSFLLLCNKTPQTQQLKMTPICLILSVDRLEFWAWHSWVLCTGSQGPESRD